MPTARELLEQAEALMRRNRSVRVDTDVTPPGTAAVIAPEPLAVGETAPAPLAEPAAVPTPPPPAGAEPTPQPLSLDDIPVLTDVVEEIEAPTIQEEPWDAGEPSDWGEFDIIEEIEAPSIVDLPEEGGEPSGWGAYDGGEPTVGGLAPDSLVVVPPVTYFRDGDGRRGAAFGARARAAAADGSDAPGEGGVMVVDESLVHEGLLATEGAGEPLVAAVASGGDATLPAGGEYPSPVPAVAAMPPAAARPEDVADDDGIVTLYDVVALDEAGTIVAVAPEAPARADLGVAEPAPPPLDEPVALAPAPAVAEVAPMAADAVGAVPAAPPDDARWQALAEEIRMQVLQRIDMFTDTGMQDQLRTRLQPIVDRASADLVATINQHVGQLLRSYVAEAIEREIEKWRGG